MNTRISALYAISLTFHLVLSERISLVERTASYEENARSELFYPNAGVSQDDLDRTVFLAIFVRNKEHTLPFFFKAVEDLDYDKKRMYIWIVCDHTKDNSGTQIKNWATAVESQYMKVETQFHAGPWHYPGQKSDLTWTDGRYLRLLELRQMALIKAREVWSDYILYIDADNILMNPYTLRHLMEKNKILIAPMLHSLSAYSNFWGGMDEKGYYRRTEEYFPIRWNEINGTFSVALVHSTFLIDLRKKKSRGLQFLPVRKDYKFDFDDIIIFAFHCKAAGVEMFVDNTVLYGYMPVPLDDTHSLQDDIDAFVHLRMEVMTEPPVGIGVEMKKSPYIEEKEIIPSRLGFDEIYVVNLKRRPDRRIRMKKVLQMQGIDFKIYDAVDSKNLTTDFLIEMGIDMLPGYVDPHRERGLTRGEIGCFLSHFNIWNEVIEKEYSKVIVLEDDVRFQPSFVRKLEALMERIERADYEWDLIYLGRKRLKNAEEFRIQEVDGLVEAGYSYWTIGYLLSKSGAEKLKDGDPLGRMVPVDEYLPIMYDKHPIDAYSDHFASRNLIALSVDPLYLYPTHYTNEINYFSDTETSTIWEEVADKVGSHSKEDEKEKVSSSNDAEETSEMANKRSSSIKDEF